MATGVSTTAAESSRVLKASAQQIKSNTSAEHAYGSPFNHQPKRRKI